MKNKHAGIRGAALVVLAAGVSAAFAACYNPGWEKVLDLTSKVKVKEVSGGARLPDGRRCLSISSAAEAAFTLSLDNERDIAVRIRASGTGPGGEALDPAKVRFETSEGVPLDPAGNGYYYLPRPARAVIVKVTEVTHEDAYRLNLELMGGDWGHIFDPCAVSFVSQNLPTQVTGGTVTTYTSGAYVYQVHTFTASGTLTVITAPPAGTADYLIVAGGGGGGYSGLTDLKAGGGGAGGLIHETGQTLAAGTYPVAVGTGGPGGATASARGTNGNDSAFNGDTAIGGGGGAYHQPGDVSGGNNGGSGGGSGSWTQPAGTGESGQGYSGGGGNDGCGGGGAGAAGYGVTGGDGLQNDITGSPVWYAGGGGGGLTTAQGGQGGGGKCGVSSGNGTDGTGGGGAGGNGSAGGRGGDGIVIIRFRLIQ